MKCAQKTMCAKSMCANDMCANSVCAKEHCPKWINTDLYKTTSIRLLQAAVRQSPHSGAEHFNQITIIFKNTCERTILLSPIIRVLEGIHYRIVTGLSAHTYTHTRERERERERKKERESCFKEDQRFESIQHLICITTTRVTYIFDHIQYVVYQFGVHSARRFNGSLGEFHLFILTCLTYNVTTNTISYMNTPIESKGI